jgi:hypothetical protein
LQLLDLATLDPGWLQFPYSQLAASALFLLHERAHVAFDVSGKLVCVCVKCVFFYKLFKNKFLTGYTETDLYNCVVFMRPFAFALREAELMPLKYYEGVYYMEQHNIQAHDASLQLFVSLFCILHFYLFNYLFTGSCN